MAEEPRTQGAPGEWHPGSPLPNAQNAEIDPAKFVGYSMVPEHPANQGKWQAFEAVGFDVVTETSRAKAAQIIIDRIRERLPITLATPGRRTVHGLRFQVEIPLRGPNGRSGDLVTVWQYDVDSNAPRLVTNWLKVFI
jgi:hypothetical protein